MPALPPGDAPALVAIPLLPDAPVPPASSAAGGLQASKELATASDAAHQHRAKIMREQ